jgi:hypothetical protein
MTMIGYDLSNFIPPGSVRLPSAWLGACVGCKADVTVPVGTTEDAPVRCGCGCAYYEYGGDLCATDSPPSTKRVSYTETQ